MRRRGLLVVLLLAALAGYFFWRGAQGPGPTLDSQELLTLLADTASQVNARGPVMVDAETRLRGAEAGPGARLTYRYELVAFNRADMDERRFVALKKPELVRQPASARRSATCSPRAPRSSTSTTTRWANASPTSDLRRATVPS